MEGLRVVQWGRRSSECTICGRTQPSGPVSPIGEQSEGPHEWCHVHELGRGKWHRQSCACALGAAGQTTYNSTAYTFGTFEKWSKLFIDHHIIATAWIIRSWKITRQQQSSIIIDSRNDTQLDRPI